VGKLKKTWRKKVKKIVLSKKFIVSIAGLIAAALVGIGVDIPQEQIAGLLAAIAAIVASFNIGQGFADGRSVGRTSAGRDIYDK
jgi:ABC-type Na+ efflux pump permease subunit